MGLWISRIIHRLSFGRDSRILMVGLDAAGKTTILYKLKLGELISTVPTIGFNVESLTYHGLNMTIWDVGGQHRIRELWRYYFSGNQAVIFVVDSCDRERIVEVKETLDWLLTEEELRNVPVLIFANKQDLPHALSTCDLSSKLGLVNARDRKWYVQSCCAVSGDGLYEGLDWLSQNMKGKA